MLLTKIHLLLKKNPINQINIKIIGLDKSSGFNCSIDAEFQQGVKDENNEGYSEYKASSISKSCKGVKPTYLQNICDSFKGMIDKHLKKSDCLVDIYIEIRHQDQETMVIKENSLSHDKVWEHYQAAIATLFNVHHFNDHRTNGP